ncbi:Golgi to ER traffic protein 4 [Homalodisca vitripennis]|nr:Golgi to ER traffic protein 4 [Homalodisca vitripennis]
MLHKAESNDKTIGGNIGDDWALSPDSPSRQLLGRGLFSMVSPEVAEREVFLGSALRWSSHDHAQFTNGHPSLHQAIAQIFWREKNFVLARYHFLHSRDGTGFATMLVELHRTRGFATEVDLFIAQVVLQYLCLQNKHTANVAFQSYTTQHPAIAKGPPYILPLLNFIFFLLKTVESGKLAAFTVLCEQYQPCIKRDPSYPQYLDKIAQIFFGVPPPRQHNSGGLLGKSFILVVQFCAVLKHK